MQTVCVSGMDRQMKGEYFTMKNHGLRRVFSLFLALFMVFTLLPTAAFAEDTTEPKPIVVEDEGQQGPKQDEVQQPAGETPDKPKDEGEQSEGENPEAPKPDEKPAKDETSGKQENSVSPQALSTGHKIDVTFTILYVSDEFRIGYNYGTSEKTQFVCQYSQPHSDTAFTNHTIKISDIKAAAGRASVNSGYQIVGWSKESNANPTTWSLNKSGTTACNKGTTIYLVAKNPNPTTKYTYTLNYDANGGTGAPSADSWSTTDASIRYHSFTVKNTIPTREGYVFKGWKAKDGADTIYAGGALCSVSQQGNDVVKNGNTWTRTLYAVWEEAAPARPKWQDFQYQLRGDIVHVTCVNPVANHPEKYYPWLSSNDDRIGEVKGSAGSYTCTVTVDLGYYLGKYDRDVRGEQHSFVSVSAITADILLKFEGGDWVVDKASLPIEVRLTCNTTPTPDKPTAPGEGDLSGLIGNITVNCTNEAATHDPKSKSYALIADSYTTSEVEGDAENGYTYTVTINSQKYVAQFDTDTGAAHDPKDVTATVTLKYTDNGWTVTSGAPVVFNVACVTEIVPPAKPGAEDLAKLEAPVEVVCTAKPETHTAASFALIEETYTVGDVVGNETDGYTCDIIITADEYVTRYNTDFGAHTLTGDNTKPLTLKYVEGRWISEETATFYVECVEELFPVKLVIYRNGDTSKAYTTVSLESQPKGHVIDLTEIKIGDYYTANYTGKYDFYGWYNDGTWNVYKKNLANPPAGLEKITVNGWTNIIGMVYDYEKVVYFQSAEALKAYQGDHSKTDGILYSTTARKGDTLPTADAPTATRTGYTFKFWSREGQSGDVTGQTVNGWTNLYANWEKNIYTVTYTDGVNGKAFADQVYNVPFEDATPAFEGTPTRKGFVFDGWTPEVAAIVTGNATYTAQWKPVQPDKKAIEGAIGRGVAVVCDNQNVNHGEKKYKPTLGEYTVSDVMGTAADGYTCTVTVKAAKFIEKYSSDMGDAVHTLIAGEPAEKTIELKWNGEEWVSETELPVTFHTLCPPEQPSKKDIEGAIGRGVKIVCDNQNVNHWGKDYKPTQGEYTVSDVTGTASEGYTCTITVKAAKIIEKYSSDMGKAHDLIIGEQSEKTVELKWDGEKWVAKTELPITFHVECPPEKPTYNDLKELGIDANVHCTTTTAHADKTYALIEGTYEISAPERKGTAYTCILTVNAKEYVAKYKAEENMGPHILDDRDSKTIELTWNGQKWTAKETSVTFNVKCDLLTVTYTDGVDGEEVFPDDVHEKLPYGSKTPAFNGTTTRKGYKFVGWEPEVAETVTGSAAYTAKWEKLYTVTYTDGVNGKAFKDQNYPNLEAGTATPKFEGKPTRKGYTFTGWSPKVTDTVTGNVTYKAQWKSTKNGKDNVPKTGDSEIVMVLGSVLLFSFCGATAVSVFDRKRKHF